MGYVHVCGLRLDGSVLCWGCDLEDDYNQCTATDGPFVQVAAGTAHTCALRPDGRVTCWGCRASADRTTDLGQCTPPDETFAQIAAGEWLTCGVRTDGAVQCWGWTDHDEQPAVARPPTGDYLQVDVSLTDDTTCALADDGHVDCFDDRLLGGEGPYSQITTTYLGWCGIGEGGRVDCMDDSYDEVVTVLDAGAMILAAGGQGVCAVTDGGRVTCGGVDGGFEEVL